ncbi:ABC transporter ATP-binding protein [Paenibacillus hunanensis]|uniref:ABC-type multidrug transport system fused ATPase/permease subunit n=1 Tax=Paenibacillus hunanensis TaxID=539262 RepID=A0ABU1J1K3_9BACL|nr:ABC transporter ATP-binding protein [Paenibacillus hunanensis]MDR6245381.1 ABC-type multidrug transport system fused ATPase/permease subunit [Paenibacillus hunanensis]GGJ27180.1 ABC transporter ATP-binding protein [Paenibacillus hunanensis]
MNEYITRRGSNITSFALFKIPFQQVPIPSIILALLAIFDGIIITLQVGVTTRLINMVVAGPDSGQMSNVWAYLLLFMLIMAYQWLSQDLSNLFKIKIDLSVSEYVNEQAIRKISRLQYSHVENNDSWDLISRVKLKLSKNVSDFFYNVLGFATLIIKIIGILIMIFNQVWWAGLFIAVLIIPLSILVKKGAKENYKAEIAITNNTRRAEYFDRMLIQKDAVEERVLFGFRDHINKKYRDYYDEAQRTRFKTKQTWFIKMKAGSVISSTFLICIIFFFLQPLLTGTITIGFFISISQAIFSLIQRLSWELTAYVDTLATINESRKDINLFFKLEEDSNALVLPSKEVFHLDSVEFENVIFKYPGTEKNILNGISFRLESKKNYAFVGANGSGKSTIIKLLTGLYHNYTGLIKINGIDIKSYPVSERHALISVLFQDFARYQITLKENILLGDINNFDANAKKMNQLIDHMGLRVLVDELPLGINTNLGKIQKDGVDISGGQWQRISIIRSLINQAPLKILDEPTASLDPISESILYEEYEKMTKGNTTILISHRLGSTKLADEIFVVDNGCIVEKGTHVELLANDNLYAHMFRSQKEWYEQ